MWASAGVVPRSGARLVIVVVTASSTSAMTVQNKTKRTRQSIRIPPTLGANVLRRSGVSEPPRMIQKRISPSAMMMIARSFVSPEPRIKMLSRLTRARL